MASPTLFSCYGVELEYMVVDRQTLRPLPWTDRILLSDTGAVVSDLEFGTITWSNELTAHVLEFKTTEPISDFGTIAADFAAQVVAANQALAPLGAQLLPTAMHPTMQPSDSVLWKHEYNDVYEAFDRIFDCHGHGWSNLQSVHLNLPFANDAEFARLHAAIRLVLPLLPALAASSPIVEGNITGWPDNRLAFYRKNSAKLPALCGRVIPEPVYSQADYAKEIYGAIGRELAPHDPNGVLKPEFSNSRGAIARFDRDSIEIRLLDIQECPAADLAVLRLIVAWIKELVAETHLSLEDQKPVGVEPLAALFNDCVERGMSAMVVEPKVLQAGGFLPQEAVTAGIFWQQLAARLQPTRDASREEREALDTILSQGNLASRIVTALPAAPGIAEIHAVYAQLAACLAENRMFSA